MKVSQFHKTLVSDDVKRTPLTVGETKRPNKGIRKAWMETKRDDADWRQSVYESLVANGPDQVRRYRNRSIRPRLGRKMRDGEA